MRVPLTHDLGRLGHAVSKRGFLGALTHGFKHLLSVQKADVLSLDLTKAKPRLEGARGMKVHKVIDPEDILVGELPNPDYARKCLFRGDAAYLALYDNAIKGYVWCTKVSHRDPWSGLTFRLYNEEAYAYNLNIDPDYRDRGTGIALMSALIQDLQRAGDTQRLYGYVRHENKVSQIFHRLVAGFRYVETVTFITCLNRGVQIPSIRRSGLGPCSRGIRSRYMQS